MKIRKAEAAEFQRVRLFYHSLIDALSGYAFDAGWKKDIYPSPEFLTESISAGGLFVGEEEGEIAAAMILNHEWNDGYDQFDWPVKADRSEVTVIHALGVHPDSGGRGLGKEMVLFAFDEAWHNHQKVIRLDVLKGNLPAEKLYEGVGFQKLHTLSQYYEDTGWADYELYEYEL